MNDDYPIYTKGGYKEQMSFKRYLPIKKTEQFLD
jgi:hypothetical protein